LAKSRFTSYVLGVGLGFALGLLVGFAIWVHP
jgi:uncharacterized membrane protein (Fun14 family)